jgi:hypothetical protein
MAESDEVSNPGAPYERWKTIKRGLSALAQQFTAAAKIDLEKPSGLADLDQYLKKLPPTEVLASKIDELRSQATQAAQEEKKRRTHGFGAVESEFIQLVKASHPLREKDSGWRIGPLEVEVNRDIAKARVLYNHDEIVPWRGVGSAHDLKRLFEDGLKKLESAKWDEERFSKLLQRAFDAVSRKAHGADPQPRVPIAELHRQVRLELVSDELQHKPDKKLTDTAFPRWAFAYNLDLYRRRNEEAGSQLLFETGSQQEQRTLGYSLNGLDAEEDTKTFCFMRRNA